MPDLHLFKPGFLDGSARCGGWEFEDLIIIRYAFFPHEKEVYQKIKERVLSRRKERVLSPSHPDVLALSQGRADLFALRSAMRKRTRLGASGVGGCKKVPLGATRIIRSP
jgi:hypothetical protein